LSQFLLEIGTEEIPASFIPPAISALKERIISALKGHSVPLSIESSCAFATPRRLVVWLGDVAQSSIERTVQQGRLPVPVALDASGNFTEAARRFAGKFGLAPRSLKRVRLADGKEFLIAESKVPPLSTVKLLAEILPDIIKKLPFPKRMYWKSPSFLFARPVRSLVALFDGEVVPFELDGLKAGREARGHHFLAPEPITLKAANLADYLEALRSRYVIVDQAERRRVILEALQKILSRHASSFQDEELLEEVVYLVECPGVIEGAFDERFLKLPREVLVESLREHQRCFPVLDGSGSVLPRFVAVVDRPGEFAPTIREGIERVISARLADADFFWKEDTKSSLESKVPRLSGIVFIEKLGTLLDKTNRLVELAEFLARRLGAGPSEVEQIKRACLLSKADLTTEMVGEFPSLQGIMGGYYAEHDGEDEEVSRAIREHYLPRYVSDPLPRGRVSSCVSLADKFDTLAACFLAGLLPSGSQDPYALRRRAQGVIRITWENRLSYSLQEVISEALELLPGGIGNVALAGRALLDFLGERLSGMLEEEGAPYDLVRALLATGFDDLCDLRERLAALLRLRREPIWESLLTLVERTYNISKNLKVEGRVEPALFEEELEKVLWQTYLRFHEEILRHFERKEAEGYFSGSLLYEKAFARTVHEFYEKVFVNVEDSNLRENRLRLLKKVNELYTKRVADLALIVRQK